MTVGDLQALELAALVAPFGPYGMLSMSSRVASTDLLLRTRSDRYPGVNDLASVLDQAATRQRVADCRKQEIAEREVQTEHHRDTQHFLKALMFL